MHTSKKCMTSLLYWKGTSKDVKWWIKECLTCQRSKSKNVFSPGLLQPLSIPKRAWSVISLDFIEGLPHFKGKDTILVMVDHLTKYGHFLALPHPFTAKTVA